MKNTLHPSVLLNSLAWVCVSTALLPLPGCGGEQKTDQLLTQALDAYRRGEYDEAIAAYDEAIQLDPKCAVAYHNRASMWSYKGDNAKAIADYKQAMKLDPQYAGALYKLAHGWFNQREYEKAVTAFNEAMQLDPERADAQAYYHRGVAFDLTGRYDKAVADYREAIRQDAEFSMSYFSLAQLLGTCPEAEYRDGKQAVENAAKVCELAGEKKTWSHLHTLAAAYAEAGDFDQAVGWQTKAIELAEKATDRQKKMLSDNLELYQAGKPFRQQRKTPDSGS
ncbi:MAG TPA: tetratricopeptide repeat protein [Thermoguttaceae bacterium]|nr:tetratricopeptide repeat protein [Thermoguttaceae bacterium]